MGADYADFAADRRDETAMNEVTDRVVIAANPFSGARKNRQRVDALCAALRDQELSPHVIWDSAQQFDQPARCIIAAGGDGTVDAVINAMSDRETPVAVLPLGNENLLAKAMGFNVKPAQLANAIARGQTRRVDLAQAGDRYFTLMLSAGFDAEVVHRVAAWRTADDGLRRIGHRSYLKPILSAFTGYDFPIVELEADGQTARGALAMIVNVPRYARNIRFTPGAACDDGLLDWVVFEKPGKVRLAMYLMSILAGRHFNRPDVHHGRAKTITLQAPQDVPLQIDGDQAGVTPVHVQVQPAAIELIDTRASH